MAHAARRTGSGYRPRGSGQEPVTDVMVAACQFVALPGNAARADDLRRALGRVRPGLSPKLDIVIERAEGVLAGVADKEALRGLLLAARDLAGVRIAPGIEQWWDR